MNMEDEILNIRTTLARIEGRLSVVASLLLGVETVLWLARPRGNGMPESSNRHSGSRKSSRRMLRSRVYGFMS